MNVPPEVLYPPVVVRILKPLESTSMSLVAEIIRRGRIAEKIGRRRIVGAARGIPDVPIARRVGSLHHQPSRHETGVHERPVGRAVAGVRAEFGEAGNFGEEVGDVIVI